MQIVLPGWLNKRLAIRMLKRHPYSAGMPVNQSWGFGLVEFESEVSQLESEIIDGWKLSGKDDLVEYIKSMKTYPKAIIEFNFRIKEVPW